LYASTRCYVPLSQNRFEKFNIHNDETFVLDFLTKKHVILFHGTAFNWKKPDHFRIVFSPHLDELKAAIQALGGAMVTDRAK